MALAKDLHTWHTCALMIEDLAVLMFCADFTEPNASDTCAFMVDVLAVSMLPAADMFEDLSYGGFLRRVLPSQAREKLSYSSNAFDKLNTSTAW